MRDECASAAATRRPTSGYSPRSPSAIAGTSPLARQFSLVCRRVRIVTVVLLRSWLRRRRRRTVPISCVYHFIYLIKSFARRLLSFTRLTGRFGFPRENLRLFVFRDAFGSCAYEIIIIIIHDEWCVRVQIINSL